MSGPEHYKFAEDFLGLADGDELGSDQERYNLLSAQVHATLALTAATIDAAAHPGQSQVDYLGQWFEVMTR